MTEIPIQNIYYLLCYAWNKLDEGKIVDVNKIDSTEIVDLFAKVLINGVSHLLKRGIDRNYIENDDLLSTIKGKLDFNSTIKRNLMFRGKAHCIFDEMNHNVLHNQILKTTIYRLLLIKELDSALQEELVKIYRYFYQIDTISLNYRAFRNVKINRNNYFYLFLLNICELIYENLLPDEESGETKFRDFVRDEKKMAFVFEEFVRQFYKLELANAKVYREDLYWGGDKDSTSILPKMETDITIETEDKKIIIDTKYYKEALTSYYDAEKIRSNNLYQIYAYLKQVEYQGKKGREAEGILLYPTVKKELGYSKIIEGHKIRFETINLNQDWKAIHTDLLALWGN